MKRLTVRTYIVCICLCFLAIAFFEGACGGTDGPATDGSATTEPETPEPETPGPAAPSIAAIRTALGANNAFGMVPGLALGEITLPECTTNDSQTLTYSMTGLPNWLAFNATTRALALAGGNTVIPQTANTATNVTYTCTAEGNSSTASVSFTVNDLDGGGVVDGKEYEFGEVPLVNPSMGWMWLTPANVDLYRTAEASPHKIPTGITVTSMGMNPTDAADDTSDFDVDGTNNGDEITNGTNIFVATSAATFAQSSAPAASDNPKGIATADLDNDGDLDIVVTSTAGGGAIRPHLNDGSGTFTAGVDYSTVSDSKDLAAADFNADGNMDIVATNSGGNSVSILLGNGNGTFGAQTPYTVGNTPYGVTAADFNRDGKVDLAVANENTDNVSILLGNGDGTFGAATNTAVGLKPQDVVFADFDADGDLDLAVANFNSITISILTNNGSGTFAETALLNSEDAPHGLTAADFNGDGAIDLAAGNELGSPQNISLFLNNGNGTFANYIALPFDNKPYSLVAADLDGDGDIDMAAVQYGDDKIGYLLNNGDGTFAAFKTINVGVGPRSLVAGDFNGDGKVDLSSANNGDGTFSVVLNQ